MSRAKRGKSRAKQSARSGRRDVSFTPDTVRHGGPLPVAFNGGWQPDAPAPLYESVCTDLHMDPIRRPESLMTRIG